MHRGMAYARPKGSLCVRETQPPLSLASSLFLTLELSLDPTCYSAALSLSNCLSLTFRVSGRISFVEHVV
jgi:hypothetical protein